MKLHAIVKYLLFTAIAILAAIGLFFVVFIMLFYGGANEGNVWMESSPDAVTGEMTHRCGKRANGEDIEISCEEYHQLEQRMQENLKTP